MCKLFNIHGTGALRGCAWCRIKGDHCKHLDKVVYLQNRIYLPADSPLRHDTSFPFTATENRDPPAQTAQEESELYVESIAQVKNKSQAKQIAKATGIKGDYPLSRLPGHDRPGQTSPDPMHTVKDVIENVVKFLSGRTDSAKVRNQEAPNCYVDSCEPVCKVFVGGVGGGRGGGGGGERRGREGGGEWLDLFTSPGKLAVVVTLNRS